MPFVIGIWLDPKVNGVFNNLLMSLHTKRNRQLLVVKKLDSLLPRCKDDLRKTHIQQGKIKLQFELELCKDNVASQQETIRGPNIPGHLVHLRMNHSTCNPYAELVSLLQLLSLTVLELRDPTCCCGVDRTVDQITGSSNHCGYTLKSN
jgi:hypothetical protein